MSPRKNKKRIDPRYFLNERMLTERAGDTPEDVAASINSMPGAYRHNAMNDWRGMADADPHSLEEFSEYYPHIPREELPAFAQQVLSLVGEQP